MRKKRYQIVLFDLDGTLTDSGEGVTNSVAYALNRFGVTARDRSELDRFIGPPLIDSFREFYGFSEADAKRAVGFYREYYEDLGIRQVYAYDGMKELLARLKENGVRLLVATSKPELFAKQVLEFCGLADYFEYIAGASMDESRTAKDEVIAYALSSVPDVVLSQTVMVGDRKFDILGAQKNGLDSIGVLFGYGTREELQTAGATYIAQTPSEIAVPILDVQC